MSVGDVRDDGSGCCVDNAEETKRDERRRGCERGVARVKSSKLGMKCMKRDESRLGDAKRI